MCHFKSCTGLRGDVFLPNMHGEVFTGQLLVNSFRARRREAAANGACSLCHVRSDGAFLHCDPMWGDENVDRKMSMPFLWSRVPEEWDFFFFWHTVPVSVALDRGSSECLKQIDLNFVKFWKEIFPPYVSSRQIQGKSFFLRNLKCLEEQQNLYIYFCLWWEGVCHLGCFCVPSVRSLSVRVADSLDLHVSFASAVLHARNFFKQEVISCSLGRCNFLPFLVGSTLWLSSLHEDKKVLVWSSWSCLFNRR